MGLLSIGDPLSLENPMDISLETPIFFIGELGSPIKIWRVFNENLGSPMKIWGLQRKSGVSNENLGSPMKFWGP